MVIDYENRFHTLSVLNFVGGKEATKKDKIRQSAAKKMDEEIAKLIPSESKIFQSVICLSNTFTDAYGLVDHSTEPDITNTTTTEASNSATPVTATSAFTTITSAATTGDTTSMSNPSRTTSAVSDGTHDTTAEAMKSDTYVSAGDVGSDSFTDLTDGSFGSETFVQTSDFRVQSDQPCNEDWTMYPYWRNEVYVSEHIS